MKGIVLAAGYATRAYPLTLNQPKHLLEVGGRPILERLLGQLAEIEGLDGVYVVTNAKFADRFRQFATSSQGPFELTVVDDGTTSDEDKLGAIGDLALVIGQEGIDEDLLVAAGDSIFGEGGLGHFARLGLAKSAPVTAVVDVGDLEAVKRYSAITTDAEGRITAFEEKPEQPGTNLPRIEAPLCERCGTPTAWPVRRCRECSGRRLAFASARAAVHYDDAVRAFVSGWKEGALRRLAAAAAAVVIEVVQPPTTEVVT